jgi:replication factor A1
MMPKYEQLVDKIARASGLTVEDVSLKVEAKCAKLSGLISKEGSAQIVASELGVSLDKEKMKVSELVAGMRKVNIVGKLVRVNKVSEFTTKNGVPGKVLGMTLADDSGNVRTVLWDATHINLFEEGKLKEGQVVEIGNASVRNDELHLSGFSEIKPSEETIENVKMEKQFVEKNILGLNSGENVKLRAVVVKVFPPRFFEVNKETGRKITEEERAKGAVAEKRALLGFVLDDGSENMKGVMFGEQIKEFGFENEELEDLDKFEKKKNQILGDEKYFSCNVRSNAMFNTTELIVNGMEDVDLDGLVEELKR